MLHCQKMSCACLLVSTHIAWPVPIDSSLRFACRKLERAGRAPLGAANQDHGQRHLWPEAQGVAGCHHAHRKISIAAGLNTAVIYQDRPFPVSGPCCTLSFAVLLLQRTAVLSIFARTMPALPMIAVASAVHYRTLRTTLLLMITTVVATVLWLGEVANTALVLCDFL